MTKNLQRKERNRNSGTSSKLKEDDVDELLRILTEKHGDTCSAPHRTLGVRTIHCGTHDSHNTAHALPMLGPPKRPKKERFTDAIASVLLLPLQKLLAHKLKRLQVFYTTSLQSCCPEYRPENEELAAATFY